MRLMRLVDGDAELEVIIGDVPVDDEAHRFGNHFDHHRIPLAVIRALAVPVYTKDAATEDWFRKMVAAPSVAVKPVLVMFEAKQLGRLYVFYYREPGLGLIIVDFTLLDRPVNALVKPLTSTQTHATEATQVKRPESNVLDQFMDHRKRKLVPEIRPPQPEIQLSKAVAKSVMLGLRIRGLTTADDHTKQLYQLTVKAATFTLKRRKQTPSAAEVQEVVERLLEVMAD